MRSHPHRISVAQILEIFGMGAVGVGFATATLSFSTVFPMGLFSGCIAPLVLRGYIALRWKASMSSLAAVLMLLIPLAMILLPGIALAFNVGMYVYFVPALWLISWVPQLILIFTRTL